MSVYERTPGDQGDGREGKLADPPEELMAEIDGLADLRWRQDAVEVLISES